MPGTNQEEGKSQVRLLQFCSAALFCLCSFRIAAWLPAYLVRPWYADHDVFATMAFGWDAGVKPYRDLISNNFPGTIYLFWCLGKTFGWGRIASLYEVDSALFFILAAMILYWSRARFGRILPGFVGLTALTSYYFGLDFSQTAQRDWHAGSLVVLGLMAAQAWPAMAGRWIAALAFSAAMLVRPQVVLILPAMLLAVTERERLSGAGRPRTVGAAAAWLVIVALAVALGFLPLFREGLVGDFLGGLRALAFGGAYNKKSAVVVLFMLRLEMTDYRLPVVVVSLVILARSSEAGPGRSLASTWVASMIGALLYAPLSPGSQPYLYHPAWVVWSVVLAAMVGLSLRSDISPRGFLYVLLALYMAGMSSPRFSQLEAVGDSLAALRNGREVHRAPEGYRHPYGDRLVLPPWEDYRDLLVYLRTRVSPGTRVANLLKGVAITGPTARLSALPAESATWVFVVKPDDEMKFARTLEEYPDSVVVMWSPGQIGKYDHPLPKLEAVVRRLYRPDARFGSLEIWRRRSADEPNRP